MKKCLCFLTIMAIVFSLFSFVSFATEIDAQHDHENHKYDHSDKACINCRYMGDTDGNGRITAMEAREILRYSVGLCTFYPYHIAYIDMNYDGTIGAADARLALRASVGLEQMQIHDFSQHVISLPTCAQKGHFESECSHCGLYVNLDIPTNAHTLISHGCDSLSKCVGCGQMIPTGVSHEYENFICFKCQKKDTEGFYNALVQFVMKNGTFEDGVYYISEEKDMELFSLCYNVQEKNLYTVASMAYESDTGEIVSFYNFLDIEPTLSNYSVELDCYSEDVLVGYGVYGLDETMLNSVSPGALTLKEFDAVPELSAMQAQFALISEGLVYDFVLWLDSYVNELLGCDATRIMGFNEM